MIEKQKFDEYDSILRAVIALIEDSFPVGDDLTEEQKEIWQRLKTLVEDMNVVFFASKKIRYNDLDRYLCARYDGAKKDVILQELSAWLGFLHEKKHERESYANRVDRAFYEYIDRAHYVDGTLLKEQIINELYKNAVENLGHLEIFYQHFSGFWGTLDYKKDNYEVVELRAKELTGHWKDFQWLYERLKDYRSKYVLMKYLEYWFTYNRDDTVLRMKEYAFRDYFDLDLLPCGRDEVIVDLGAYTGDTIRDFVEVYGDYNKVFCFEVSPWNVEELKQTLEGLHDVTIIDKAAGDVPGKTEMFISPIVDSCNSRDIEIGYRTEIEVVRVDDEVKDKVTLIKMDIEGAEQSALLGCREHIVNDYPKLLISVYHNNEDLWKIPQMVYEMRDDYDFYLRSNGDQYGPSEIVFYALPQKRSYDHAAGSGSYADIVQQDKLSRNAIRNEIAGSPCEYRSYIKLSRYYASKGKDHQALICLKQALLYCDTEDANRMIRDEVRSYEKKGIRVPKTAIVILSWNLLDFTRQCINSVRQTTLAEDTQIIVVDNASTDGSVEWLREQKDIIVLCNEKNEGFPRGCNQGIALADPLADIFLLNNDTVLPYNALFWLKIGLYENEKVGSTGSMSNYVSNRQAIEENFQDPAEVLEYAMRHNIPMEDAYVSKVYLVGFALLLKRTALDQVGLLDERFSPGNSEDVDIGIRMLLAGYDNILCRNSVILHFGSQSFSKLGEEFKSVMLGNIEKLNEKYRVDFIKMLSDGDHPSEVLEEIQRQM